MKARPGGFLPGDPHSKQAGSQHAPQGRGHCGVSTDYKHKPLLTQIPLADKRTNLGHYLSKNTFIQSLPIFYNESPNKALRPRSPKQTGAPEWIQRAILGSP